MTKEELIKLGYTPKQCKIGTLYFKHPWFCKLTQNNTVDYRHYSNDMKSLGYASTYDEILEIEQNYYKDLLIQKEQELNLIKLAIEGYDKRRTDRLRES